MLKKMLVASLVLAFVAAPATASLQCTITCLAENQLCDEGPTICAMIFEICSDLCENPPEIWLSQPPSTDDSVSLLFPAEPWFARVDADQECLTASL